MGWNFREVINAETKEKANELFLLALELKDVTRWDVKVDSFRNTLQYPNTWIIDYRARKRKGDKY